MSAFFSPYRHQFVRVAACVPQVAVAEPAKNADQVLALLTKADGAGVALMVFPELCLSAYAIDDLLFQDAVLDAVVVDVAHGRRLFGDSGDVVPHLGEQRPLEEGEGERPRAAPVIHELCRSGDDHQIGPAECAIGGEEVTSLRERAADDRPPGWQRRGGPQRHGNEAQKERQHGSLHNDLLASAQRPWPRCRRHRDGQQTLVYQLYRSAVLLSFPAMQRWIGKYLRQARSL